ncbi:MAG: twitching motility protein PilT [Frankiales bacterium]|nr:twitching motility protein PilT [Frankiales bacterium]
METNAFDEFFSPTAPGAPQAASPLDPSWTPDAPVAPVTGLSAGVATTLPASQSPDLGVTPAVSGFTPIPLSPAPRPSAPTLAPAPMRAPSATVAPAALAVPAPALAPRGAAEASGPLPAVPDREVPPRQASPEVPSQPGHGADTSAAARKPLGESDHDFEGPSLADMLIRVLEMGASDLHLAAGARPTVRHHGHLQPLEDQPELTPPVIQRMMYAILTQKQREKFEEVLELDFAYAVPGKARFRVNIYRQRDALGAAFRLIPFEIKKLEDLGVPPAVSNFAMLPRGFVLVTGPTGSGKSTTLAALVDLANRQRHDHIMTVEDPIEFLHQHKSCIINQREVGEDTHSFQAALKHVLRQDPDIILVGEMRDLETISVALTAAETGHLVYATLHTSDAAQTIDRIIDVFPPHQQQQVRVQLAGAIQGVVCQTLARTTDGKGRVVATEVMVVTPAIRNLIREGKTHQIYSAMQAGAKFGMHTMDQHLAELVKQGRITYETGLEKCHHIEDFQRLAGRG